MSRNTLLSARDLLAQLGHTLRSQGGRHRLADHDQPTEALPIVAEPRELLGLADKLTRLGADVRVVEREPNGDCDWCDVDPARPAEVTVYGDPAENDPTEPLGMAEICRVCAPRAAHQALVEQNPTSGRPIVVEIGVSPR